MVRLNQQFVTTLADYPIDCAWNSSDTRLAVALAGGEIFLKDLKGQQTTWIAHKIGCTKVVWLDDVRLATAGQDGKLNIWNAENSELIGSFDVNEQSPKAWVEQLVFNEKMQLLAASAGKSLKIFDKNLTLRYHFTGHGSTVSGLSFSENGQKLAAAYYGGVNLYQFQKDDYNMEVMPYPISFVSLAVSPNGRFVAAGTQDKCLHFWLLPYSEGEDLEMTGYPKKIECMAWTSDGQHLITASQRMLISWGINPQTNSPQGNRATMLDDHDAPVKAIATQRVGPLAASGDAQGRVLVWDYPVSEYVQTEWEINGSITALAWSNNEKYLAATSEKGAVAVWDVKR